MPYDDYPGLPLKPGELYVGSHFNKYDEPYYHIYEQDEWNEFPQPQTRFRIFEVRTPVNSCGVPKQYPQCWEIELDEILAELPNKGHKPPSAAGLEVKVAKLHKKYESLEAEVKKQWDEYRKLRDFHHKTSEKLNAKLWCLFVAKKKEALLFAK